MFVQNKVAINPKEKNGLAMRSRLGGREVLVQWANGIQRWHPSDDIAGALRFVDLENSGDYGADDHGA